MRRIYLIKHARPQVIEDLPSQEWLLGPDGKDGAERVAQKLRPSALGRLFSSPEPKALQTASIIGEQLGQTVEQVHDLREHDRSNVPHMDSREFISLMALFFRDADRLVLGNETADEAHNRFAQAVDQIIGQTDADIGIISHGTVISLFAQHRAKQDPFALWRRMGQPSYIAFEFPSWKVIDLCDRI